MNATYSIDKRGTEVVNGEVYLRYFVWRAVFEENGVESVAAGEYLYPEGVDMLDSDFTESYFQANLDQWITGATKEQIEGYHSEGLQRKSRIESLTYTDNRSASEKRRAEYPTLEELIEELDAADLLPANIKGKLNALKAQYPDE